MKKLTLFALAICFTAFSFAQNQGQWSFGAGGDFTAPGAGDDNFNANIGYFAIDGLMLSFSFNMTMDYESQVHAVDAEGNHLLAEDGTHIMGTVTTEGGFEWGAAMRYYAVDNMFVEAEMSTGTGEDPDIYFAGGVSLPLGFEDKLWFEPMLKFTMPGEEYGQASQNTLGLAWAFRYTF